MTCSALGSIIGPMLHQPTDPRKLLLLAARVGCDPRTAQKWLEGSDVRGRFLTERLEREAKRIGLRRAK